MMLVLFFFLGLVVYVRMTQKTAAAESQTSAGRSPVQCDCESVCVNLWLCCEIACVARVHENGVQMRPGMPNSCAEATKKASIGASIAAVY